MIASPASTAITWVRLRSMSGMVVQFRPLPKSNQGDQGPETGQRRPPGAAPIGYFQLVVTRYNFRWNSPTWTGGRLPTEAALEAIVGELPESIGAAMAAL